jgi:tRNA 2-selenouridine synthase SelU
MKEFTESEIFNASNVIVLTHAQTQQIVEMFQQNNHAGIGQIICRHIQDDMLASRARWVEILKSLFVGGAGR